MLAKTEGNSATCSLKCCKCIRSHGGWDLRDCGWDLGFSLKSISNINWNSSKSFLFANSTSLEKVHQLQDMLGRYGFSHHTSPAKLTGWTGSCASGGGRPARRSRCGGAWGEMRWKYHGVSSFVSESNEIYILFCNRWMQDGTYFLCRSPVQYKHRGSHVNDGGKLSVLAITSCQLDLGTCLTHRHLWHRMGGFRHQWWQYLLLFSAGKGLFWGENGRVSTGTSNSFTLLLYFMIH